MYYYPPGLRHEIRFSKGPIYVLGWRESVRSDMRTGRSLMQKDSAGRILLILTWMFELFPPTDDEKHDTLNALLRVLLHSIRQTEMRHEPDRILRARRYLEFHVSEKVRLRDVAVVSGMSPFHLIREFRRVTGFSPMRYLRNVRMETACNILRATDLPLKSVAQQVGMHDASHLAHLLRKNTGKTSQQLRVCHQEQGARMLSSIGDAGRNCANGE